MTLDIVLDEFAISSKWINSLKPFHFMVDSELKIVSLGDALSKVIPDSSADDRIDAIFSSNLSLNSFETIKGHKNKLIILKSKNSDFNIYGSVLISKSEKYVLFLTSLQLIDLDTLDNFNLSINDFPLADTTVDHMIALQTAKSAVSENKDLIRRLQKEKKGISDARTKLEHVFNSANVAILEVSFENNTEFSWESFLRGRILAKNKQANKLFDFSNIENVELSLNEAFGSCLAEEFEGLEEVFLKDNSQKTFEIKIPISAHRTLHTVVTVSTKSYDGSNHSYITIVDVSKQKSLQEAFTELQLTQTELVQASKLATLGTMAAGIAHELANPLAAVKGFCQILHTKSKQSELENLFAKTLKAVDRLESVVLHLRALSRDTSQDDKEIFDVRESIYDSYNTFEHPFSKGDIDVEFTFPAGKTLIFANKTDVDTIFSNLFSNSIDSFRSMDTKQQSKVKVSIKKEGSQLQLRYSDNAKGISKDLLERIFDPFFTTKKVGEGTGLGLNLVKNIVKTLNGTIQVSSEEGMGSLFKIGLIAVNEFIPSYSNAKISTDTIHGITQQTTKTVLVVDDEPDICDLIEHTLSESFTVHTSLSANSAIQHIHTKKIDCVVLDYRMPEITGLQLAKKIKRLKPKMPIVMISGDLKLRVQMDGFEDVEISKIFYKPFSNLDALATSIRELTDPDAI